MSFFCCNFAAMLARGRYAIFLLGILCVVWQGCSPRALHEAQRVVAEADSLWKAGQAYDDSTQLAQAYRRLGNWQWLYADAYAHSCYHYGKLLRTHDDPVSAMQAFINATHSRTHDYHILGRVYSNMGSICHLANEFSLAYDMYERSSETFLLDHDTLSYYYLLNDMAFESAEQGKKEETLNLVSKIAEGCTDEDVLTKTWETKAVLYRMTAQYDSTIYYINKIQQSGRVSSLGNTIKAQAYDNLGIVDSALLYANKVLADSNATYQNIFNAIYIVSHLDSSLCSDDVRAYASKREDIRYYEHEPEKEKLTDAIYLLSQDLHRKPNLVWLYVMIATIIVASGCFYWRIKVRKRQMEKRVGQLIEHQADTITQSIKHHIDTNDIAHTLHWKNYAAMKADADLYMGGIVSKLEKRHLNETEIRFCVLTMLDFSLSRIAETIHYSYPSGIKTLKKRVSVKLGTIPPELRVFLFQMAANG